MAPRGERILVVSFGPAATPVLATAVAFSRTHASSVEPGGPGGYRASFSLDRDPEVYGRADQLIRMTSGWKATHAEVEGRPVRIRTIQLMLDCARGELEETGSCRRAIPASGFPKCRSCPLFDPEWAYESEGPSRSPMFGIALGVVDDDPELVVPDTILEEWLREPPPD
jgi:hypothetical protein